MSGSDGTGDTATALLVLLGGDVSAEDTLEAIRLLAALSEEAWAGHVGTIPALREAEFLVARMNDRAFALLDSDPALAADVAFVAARIAAGLTSPEVEATRAMILEADAWRHYAAAKATMHECHAALEAIRIAQTFYDVSPMQETIEASARLRLIKARVKYQLGDAQAALGEAEVSANVLKYICRNTALWVKARLYYAWILQEESRYEEALDIYERCTPLVERAGDAETLVSILENVAVCVRDLGDGRRAADLFAAALAMAERLGMKWRLPSIRYEMIVMLIQRGRYNAAISELFKNHSDFLALGMPVLAAEVASRIVETLMLGGRTRDIRGLCEKMMETFTKANLPNEVRKALAYMAELARQGLLMPKDVEHVRSFIASVGHGRAEATFQPPSVM